MKNRTVRQAFAIILFASIFWAFGAHQSIAANYPLEIILPEAADNIDNRYYKAYPGIQYEVPIGLFGGAYPFTYSLDTAPSGMTINEDTGIITWSNPTISGSPHSVTVRVIDDESTQITRSWTITVTTSGFVFIDSINGSNSSYNGGTGTGTLTNPFREMIDVYNGDGSEAPLHALDTDYDDYFVYLRTGTYYPQGPIHSSGQQNSHVNWRVTKPIIWMAYPSESVTIDYDHSSASEAGAGFWLDEGSGHDDLWVQGITFQDMKNNAILFGGQLHNAVIYDNIFQGIGQGVDGYNSGYLEYRGDGPPASNSYHLISYNTFGPAEVGGIPAVKMYESRKVVIANNSMDRTNVSPKEWSLYTDIRANHFDNNIYGAIAGNWNEAAEMEIRFNRVTNSSPSGVGGQMGALVINYHNTAGRVYIYRNTFEGAVTLRGGTADDGPFHLYNNVIVNENAAIDNPDGSLIGQYDVNDDSCLILGAGGQANLVGSASAGIIDANGNLTSGYLSYLGTHGHQTSGTTPAPPPLTISSPRFFRIP